MTIEKMIEVMTAYKEGKQIQRRECGFNAWYDISEPLWNWDDFDYRIKAEEEKPVRMTNRQLAEWVFSTGEWTDGANVYPSFF